jgi:hypothetical protein
MEWDKTKPLGTVASNRHNVSALTYKIPCIHSHNNNDELEWDETKPLGRVASNGHNVSALYL